MQEGTIELTALTAVEAVTAIAAGDITAAALAEALIEQAQRWQAVNALVNFNGDDFLAAAQAADEKRAAGGPLAPLHGLPMVVKDNIDVAGFATTAATPALAGHFPGHDAPVVRALRDAGAIVMAKANMHELAFSPGITPPEGGGKIIYGAHGAARNPYDLKRSPAGSSTGTAAAIAAQVAPAGLGSDTGGSVRNPAAWCGLAGFRPSIGRYEQTGVVPISWTRDTIGPMARSIGDLVLLDGIITGESQPPVAELDKVRLGLDRDFFCTDADADILDIFEGEIDRLTAAGAEIVDVKIPGLEELIGAAGQGIAMYEIIRALPRYLVESGSGVTLDAVFSNIAASGLSARLDGLCGTEAISEADYRTSMDEVRPALQSVYADCFQANRLDALIFPATLILPYMLQEPGTHMHKGEEISDFAASGHNVQPASIGGSPGLTITAGITPAGLPAAIGFDGPFGHDAKLLAIGKAYEAIRPPIPAPPVPILHQTVS
tara:strand:+ start:8538 stop:10010 length:1473 start_codon:yes stop_codon:yes gene_type:complete